MSNGAVKTLVRMLFSLTSRATANRQIRIMLDAYLRLASQSDSATGAQPILVPPMRGVDEDMREWSLFMILEHNTIVNRSITSVVAQLCRGEEPTGAGAIDPKRDVMPSISPGEEQAEAFRRSVDEHLQTVSSLGPLRCTRTKNHPIFGPFDAHKWNCMFAFHLKLHLKQAQAVLSAVSRPH